MLEITIFVLAVMFALLLSNVISLIFPKLPLPIIQVFLGIIVSFVSNQDALHMEPELFLAMIIAPIVFREGQESDVTSFIKHRNIIAYLIFPVVFISTLVMGYVAKGFLPDEVPLAACFALGAALSPTDAVAFASLSHRFAFPKYIKNILEAEGLLNDASGLVVFQMALVALVSGSFSLLNAGLSLVWAILGGMVVGILMTLVARFILSTLESFNVISVTNNLLVEFSLPLLSFLIASIIDVSSIIAVVASGIMQASRFKRVNLYDARVDEVTANVWQTLTFVLNGLVFILLGTELIRIVEPIFLSPFYSNLMLVTGIILLTALIFLIRFVMIAVYYAVRTKRLKKQFKTYLNDMLILTFSGVKGTMSIATILLIPAALAEKYSLVLFFVASVTMLSFLTGILVLPKLAKPQVSQPNYFMEISILNEVSTILESDMQVAKNKLPYYAAIDSYWRRIERLIFAQENEQIKREHADLQLLMISIENDGLQARFEEGELSIRAYRLYQGYLRYLEREVNRSFVSSISYSLTVLWRICHSAITEFLSFGKNIRHFLSQKSQMTSDDIEAILELYLANTEVIMDSLEDLEGIYDSNLVNFLQLQRLRQAELLSTGTFIERVIMRLKPYNINEMLRAFYLERKIIAEYEKDKMISSRHAKLLRQNVNQLENYTLKESANTLIYDMIRYRQNINQENRG